MMARGSADAISSARTGGRAFVRAGATFLIAAAVIAIANAIAPFAHGWWLVAYLALVGGVAQLLLGPGLIWLGARGGARALAGRRGRSTFALWNVGTLVVAAADLAAMPPGVVAGSVLLVWALSLFAIELRRAEPLARRVAPAWVRGYAFLLAFLGASVIVGIVLGYRGAT